MFTHLAHRVREAASRTAKTAMLGLGAACSLIIGLGFLNLAAWLYLTSVTVPLNAALILAGFYLGCGLIGFAVVSARTRSHAPPPPAAATAPGAGQDTALTQLVMVFLAGLNAGQKARF